MQAHRSKAKRLTTWRVCAGGAAGLMEFVATDGAVQHLVVPVDLLSSLMSTLPQMLQSALDERFPDGSFRIVQRLETWRLEQPAHDDGVILKLGTADGFEVAFAMDSRHAAHLGSALLTAPNEMKPNLERRPN